GRGPRPARRAGRPGRPAAAPRRAARRPRGPSYPPAPSIARSARVHRLVLASPTRSSARQGRREGSGAAGDGPRSPPTGPPPRWRSGRGGSGGGEPGLHAPELLVVDDAVGPERGEHRQPV